MRHFRVSLVAPSTLVLDSTLDTRGTIWHVPVTPDLTITAFQTAHMLSHAPRLGGRFPTVLRRRVG